MDTIIITNNPIVNEKFPQSKVYDPSFSVLDVLIAARDHIHRGHRLLTHPLAGSVKPNQTPYKTVVVSADHSVAVDTESLMLIEDAILITRQMLDDAAPRSWSESVHSDFQLIDYSLIAKAMNV